MWTITGQTSKAMDATSRTLAAIGAQNPKVAFRSLAADTLTWTVLLAGFAPAAEIIPELGQEVALYRSGTRFFCGHVSAVKQSGRTVSVTVSNAWWWLERVFLASTQTDGTGASGTRATFALTAQPLAASFTALANAAIALGVPMQLGALAGTFNAPELRLNQMSFAQALGEVARVTPDLVTWFDYTVAGLPALRTSRRLTAAATTVDPRAAERFALNPLTELQLTAVEIPYLIRAADGAKQFATQSAGVPAVGKTQLITVSGDEMDTFLPKDLLDSVTVQSADYTTLELALYDTNLKTFFEQYGPVNGGITYGNRVRYYTGDSVKRTPVDVWLTGLQTQAKNGAAIPAGTVYLITTAEALPDWAVTAMGGVAVTITGTMIAWEYSNANGWSPCFDALYNSSPSWGGPTWISEHPSTQMFYWCARPLKVEGVLVPTHYASATPVYKPADYGFAFPPAGFADGLLAAQNYIPYDGEIELMAAECGDQRYLQNALNVSNSLPAHAAMKAMLSSEELDLQTGVTTLVIGPPARFSYRELVNRLRGSSNDNIIYV